MIGGGGGGGAPPPQSGSSNPGGQFLLQLLQNPHQPQTSTTPTQPQPQPQPSHQQQQDPAVASMGPTLPFSSSNGQDPHSPSPLPPWLITPHHPGFAPPPWVLAGLPPRPSNFPPANFPFFPAEDLQKLGLLGSGQQQQYLQQRNMETLMFGSLPNKNSIDRSQFGVHKVPEVVVGANRSLNGAEIGFNSGRNLELDHQLNSNFGAGAGGGMGKRQQQPVQHTPVGGGGGGWGRNQQPVHHAPPGFQQKQKGHDQQGLRRKLGHNVDREAGGRDEFNSIIQHDGSSRLGLGTQLDHPGPPGGSKLHSVPASEIEESLATLHGQAAEEDRKQRLERRENRSRDEANGSMYPMDGGREQEELSELMHAVKVRDEFERRNVVEKYNTSRDKDLRSDLQSDVFREVTVPSQRMRNPRRVVICRSNIDTMNGAFLRIFESLVPVEEEKAKQKQLLQLLEKLVNKEWPRAELYLYGSCANSFGVSKSDIDVCLAIEDENTTKPEILLKLADLLQSDNLQNVQALTRARVPIVKLMDPITGISCDICINNVLAVVNTKLLRDYAQIDVRLRQLAFIVKHWAKSRGVNVTYQGTLSSYAYVLMCIHFLQQRKPAILPCLQRMEATYVVTVDEIECAYFDQVEKLHDFGAQNKESIAQLVWAFFDYWAFRHDYANAVISVRTGSIISKREKDWTRRIGNDRHLICIEDPFEVSHDLGRVVDKYSIKILREEFERAADILQYAPDPCVTLFEPYVPEPSTTS